MIHEGAMRRNYLGGCRLPHAGLDVPASLGPRSWRSLYYISLNGLPVQEYWHDMKFWWPHNEALIATIYAYQQTREPRYAKMHEQVHHWAFSHFKTPNMANGSVPAPRRHCVEPSQGQPLEKRLPSSTCSPYRGLIAEEAGYPGLCPESFRPIKSMGVFSPWRLKKLVFESKSSRFGEVSQMGQNRPPEGPCFARVKSF